MFIASRCPTLPVALLRDLPLSRLTVPCVRCSTFGSRAFASAGPTVWNSLSEDLRDSAGGMTSFDVI